MPRQKMVESLNGVEATDVKPSEEDKEETQRRIQEEYVKAYYAALLARQQEAQQAITPMQELLVALDEDVKEEVREVGVKAKIEDEEDEDEVEWEEAGPIDNGSQCCRRIHILIMEVGSSLEPAGICKK